MTICYGMLQRTAEAISSCMMQFDWDALTWNSYRTWAAVRATGRIPVLCHGTWQLPYSLPSCPLCGSPNADVPHVLAHCAGTRDLFFAWVAQSKWDPAQTALRDLLMALFAGRLGHPQPDEKLAAARICFVGAAFRRFSDAREQEAQIETSIHDLINAAASSV